MPRIIKKISLSRHDISEKIRRLDWAQSIVPTPEEAADPRRRKEVNSFKWWTGRALTTLIKIQESTQELLDGAGYPEPQKPGEDYERDVKPRIDAFNQGIYATYTKMAGEIKAKLEELAERDGRGTVIYVEKKGEDDKPALPWLTRANEEKFAAWRKDYEAQFPDVAEWMEQRKKLQSVILDERVEVELTCIDWSTMPSKVSGEIQEHIAFMLLNCPDDEPIASEGCAGAAESP